MMAGRAIDLVAGLPGGPRGGKAPSAWGKRAARRCNNELDTHDLLSEMASGRGGAEAAGEGEASDPPEKRQRLSDLLELNSPHRKMSGKAVRKAFARIMGYAASLSLSLSLSLFPSFPPSVPPSLSLPRGRRQ